MFNKLINSDNYIFIISILLSSLVCYFAVGAENITLGIISVLFTFIIYSAKPNNSDYAYIFIWLVIILLGCYIGIILKLSLGFYIFLFIISNYYYISYGKDPFSDRSIPYMVIYASLGTTISNLNYKSAIAFFIGVLITLLILRIVHKEKMQFSAFKTGLFSKDLYTNHSKKQLYNSIIYSFLLFLCLYLPDQMGLQRAYWAPMTFIMLLKPQGEGTVSNTLMRFYGSILGGAAVILLLNLEGHLPILNFIIIGIAAFMLPTFFKMKYLVKIFATTVFILLVLESTYYLKDPNYTLPYIRIFETFIGGSLAILGSFLNNIKNPIHISRARYKNH